MELVGALVFGFLALLGAALSNQIADEYKSWTPWIVEWLIQRSVSKLPEDQRERYGEEWQAYVNDIPGETGKILTAIGFLRASWKMNSISRRQNHHRSPGVDHSSFIETMNPHFDLSAASYLRQASEEDRLELKDFFGSLRSGPVKAKFARVNNHVIVLLNHHVITILKNSSGGFCVTKIEKIDGD